MGALVNHGTSFLCIANSNRSSSGGVIDCVQVNRQWVRRAFWYGQARPTGEWSARLFESRYGVHGTWLDCAEESEDGTSGTNRTSPGMTTPRGSVTCKYIASGLPEGTNTVAFRAIAPDGTDVGVVNYTVVMDTDSPIAFLVQCPFGTTAASVWCAADGSGTSFVVRDDGVSTTGVPFASRSPTLQVTLMHRDSDTRLCELPVCASPADVSQGCQPCQRGSPVRMCARVCVHVCV